MKRENLHRWLASAALVAAGVIAGNALQTPNTATGAQPIPPPTFQSGGQLSLPILKEIATTLHRMDARLERLETIALKTQATKK